MRASAAALMAMLALAGCGGDSDETAPPITPPSGTPVTTQLEGGGITETLEAPPRCEAAGSDLTTPLTNGIEPEGMQLTRAYVVKSVDHDSVYFVSAEIDGPGYEKNGDIATWASTSRYGGELLYAVDDLANKLSTLRDGTRVAELSMSDDGVETSRACAA